MKSNLIRAYLCFFFLSCLSTISFLNAQVLRITEPSPGTLQVSFLNNSNTDQLIFGNGTVQLDAPIGTFSPLPALTLAPNFTLLTGGGSSGLMLGTTCTTGSESLEVTVTTTLTDPVAPGMEVPLFSFARPVCTNQAGMISLSTTCGSSFTASSGIFPFGMITQATPDPSAPFVNCDPLSPLPVELLSFTASAEDGSALLAWETASELNNDGFNVQRSFDASNWETIGWVAGNGTTNRQMSYTFNDHKPRNGNNYYRLEQRDLDGKTELTEIRHLVFGSGPEEVAVFPNPTEGVFILDMPGYSNGEVLLRATDATGRVVFEQHNLDFSNTRQELDFTHLAPGLYQLNVSYPLGSETVQLIIARE